jgi:stage II sporulation protein D
MLLASCASSPVDESLLEGGIPLVRVAIARNVRDVTLSISGPALLSNDRTGEGLFKCNSLDASRVEPIAGGFKIGATVVPSSRVRIEPESGSAVTVNDIVYRGNILLVPGRNTESGKPTLTVVNKLNIEQYLCGVIGAEMPTNWPLDSLRAQAIAARSYAVYQLKTRSNAGDYELTNGQECQVYLGTKKENERVRRVVAETRGLILTYDWRVFQTYFSSTCGGGTVKARDVFGDPDIPPLAGTECNYCEGSPAYSWSATIPKKEVSEKLAARGIKTGLIREIIVLNEDHTGRAREVEIRTGAGKVKMDAYKFRLAVGSMKIKGTRFKITDAGNSLSISGRGFGHYVGMCQFGALGMAESGYNAARILSHYYPGSDLTLLY